MTEPFDSPVWDVLHSLFAPLSAAIDPSHPVPTMTTCEYAQATDSSAMAEYEARISRLILGEPKRLSVRRGRNRKAGEVEAE